MPILNELATLVKRQRAEMGLTQERLAELAGLSRVTINQLETGKIGNLSLINAEQLANVVGYGLGVIGVRKAKDDVSQALEIAAKTASVSYTDPIPPETLRLAILHGVVAPNYIPQLRVLLDEAPVGVLSDITRQLEREDGVRPRSTWQKMRQLAAALGCTRGIWS
ncbi:helix-turn-helix transcriptional regulator [Variovorax sp. LjRoot84]|uniref:helix-turn-helix transcriptional regulator n=1 Tax=Variovorax sp. LjRoot84 TaxID=3342340 RepID=UPI003ECC9683